MFAFRSNLKHLVISFTHWNEGRCLIIPTFAFYDETSEVAEVQPSRRFYTHRVLSHYSGLVLKRVIFWIGTAAGDITGWCYNEHIMGRAVRWDQG